MSNQKQKKEKEKEKEKRNYNDPFVRNVKKSARSARAQVANTTGSIFSFSSVKLALTLGVFLSLATLFFISGAFGETRFNLTLKTNPTLEDGLIGHWTFDGKDIDISNRLAEVRDVSGQGNHGDMVNFLDAATTTEILVDSTASTVDLSISNTGSQLVWISDTDGFMFYRDSDNDMKMASTTDRGLTWGNVQDVDSANSSVIKSAVWYDQWTPGDLTGTKIHILTVDNTNSDSFYTEYDTVTNVLSTTVNTVVEGSTDFSQLDYISITKVEDGSLYVVVNSLSDRWVHSCSSLCTNAVNWSALTDPFPASPGHDLMTLLPVANTDNVMLINWAASDDDIESNIYSATSTSWWGWDTGINQNEEKNNDYRGSLIGATINRNTGKAYMAYVGDADDYTTEDHDIEFWEFDNSTFVWTQKTDVLTNISGGLTSVKVAVDENTGDLYAVYGRRTTIGTATTGNIYYASSTDNGTTWSAESVALNSTPDDIYGILINPMSSERIGVMWKYLTTPNQDDLYYADVEDLIPSVPGPVVGKIGQALSFDGSDDTIIVPADSSINDLSAITISAWNNTRSGGEIDRGVIAQKSGGIDPPIAGWLFHHLNTDRLSFSVDYDGADNLLCQILNSPIVRNVWEHYLVTWDGTANHSGIEFYIDGVLQTKQSAVCTDGVGSRVSDSGENLYIGSNSGTERTLDGAQDDVRIYNRALSADEVKRLYDLGATTHVNTTLSSGSLDDGLIGHWTFDGKDITTDQILDTSGNVEHGGFVGSATTTAVKIGRIGQALEFDGANNSVVLSSTVSINSDFTVSAWIYPESDSTYMAVIAGQADTWNNFGLNTNTAFCHRWYNATDEGGCSDNGAISFDEWSLVTSVYNGSELLLYKNGQLIKTLVEDQDPTSAFTNLGSTSNLGNKFDGTIDDARIYNRALSAEEVKRLYDLGATTHVNTTISSGSLDDGLVGHWTFDGKDIVDNFIDSSGNGNNGYLADADGSLNKATTTSIGRIGQAYNFSGQDNEEYVRVLDSSELRLTTTGTIALWAKPDTLTQSSFAGFISKRNDVGAGGFPDLDYNIHWRQGSGVIRGGLTSDTGGVSIDVSVPTDLEWHHYMLTWDGSDLYFYTDGVQTGTTPQTQTPVENSDHHVAIGGDVFSTDSAADHFNGSLDDVRIYNRFLSAEEVKRLYDLGR